MTVKLTSFCRLDYTNSRLQERHPKGLFSWSLYYPGPKSSSHTSNTEKAEFKATGTTKDEGITLGDSQIDATSAE